MVKFVDGELSASEREQFLSMMAEDEKLAAEVDEMVSVSRMLSEEIVSSQEPPYPDFFNSQLMRKVDLDMEARTPVKRAKRWWSGLKWAWVPAGALALVMAFFAGNKLGSTNPQGSGIAGGGSSGRGEASAVYFAVESVQAEVIPDSGGNIVIKVEGLNPIRDEIDFVTVSSEEDLPAGFVEAKVREFR